MDSLQGITLLTIGTILIGVVVFWKASNKSVNTDSAGVKGSGNALSNNSDNLIKLEREIRDKNFIVIEQIIGEINSYPAEKQKIIRDILSDSGVAEHYQAQLSDSNSALRAAAAETLGKIRDLKAQEPLFMAMADKNEEVRLAATEALKSLGDPSIAELLVKSLKDPNRWLPARVAEVLVSLGNGALPALQDALEDNDPNFRGYIIEILGEIGIPSSVSALHRALMDRSVNVRLEAARALGKIGSKESVQPLIEALGEPEIKVVVQAITSLAKIGGPEVSEHFGEMLEHRDSVVRYTALDALSRMGQEGLKIIKKTALIDGHPSAEKAKEIIGEIEGAGASIKIRYK
ncbi:HEAT repeat domain-containing protein [Phosphitispora sp. TUW77]|uniref:HEAT repeat domain-containing protein n=1 Tax=Phosphitispora sp. TUW77 TaxID=3152361 RepID=UPI003AB6B3E0